MFSLRSGFVVSLLLIMFGSLHFYENDVESDNLAIRVYVALDEALRFIYDNINDMNVDGMFGVILVEAHLRSISPHVTHPQFEYLTNLTSYIIKQFKTHHSNASSRNEMFMRYLLNVNLWIQDVQFVYGQFNEKSYVDYESCPQYLDSLANMHFSEELSDDCLIQVIEGSLNEGRLCLLNDACFEFIDKYLYLPGYAITHKLLLVQTIRALKCKWNYSWIHKKAEDFCSNIYHETKKIQNCGYIPALDDLLLEQIVVCGYEGFEDFLSMEWIEHVLRIQSAHGCFGTFTSTSVFEKREANLIKHNCIDHTTGLGAAALSLFLRFLTVTGKGGTFLILEHYADYDNQTVAKEA